MKAGTWAVMGGVVWVGCACAGATAQLVFDGAVMDAMGRVERAGVASIRLGPGATPEMVVIDARGTARARGMEEVLAFVPRGWAESLSMSGTTTGASGVDAWTLAGAPYVELVDGQRFVGRPGKIGAEGETIAWVHERFGTLLIPIDEVSRFVMRPSIEAARGARWGSAGLAGAGEVAAKTDSLWLVNGDRLEGFLETVGPRTGGEGFVLTMEVQGSRVTVPVDQVVRAQLANPARGARGMVAWLADGSVVGLTSVTTDTTRHTLMLTASAGGESPGAMATAALAPEEVIGLVIDAGRVSALAGLRAVSHRAIGLPRRPGPRVDAVDVVPIPLGAADVVIPGPMEVEWEIPAGARRVVGAARLDEADWVWGECVLVLEVVGGSGAREVLRVNLGGSSVAVPVGAELGAMRAGDRLRARVEAGELGPIRDRVRLERVVLVR